MGISGTVESQHIVPYAPHRQLSSFCFSCNYIAYARSPSGGGGRRSQLSCPFWRYRDPGWSVNARELYGQPASSFSQFCPVEQADMDVVTKKFHCGRWRLLCHILWLLCRLFRGRNYDTMATALYHLTIEDLETLKACLYHQTIGGTQPSDDLVERLIRIAGRITKVSPQNELLQQVILHMLDNRINPPEVETTNSPRSLAGNIFLSFYQRQPVPSHPTNFPPAGRVFDLLMGRDTIQRDHPSQLSSVLVHLASVIELDAFETVRYKLLSLWEAPFLAVQLIIPGTPGRL